MILQILNQALAPPTLQLLYQLLQQIKFLQQLQQQQLYFTQHGGKPGSPPLQLSVQITQAKQHIVNLQNQIAAQQALFLKQVCLLIFIANSFCLMIYIFSKWDAYNGQCIIFFKDENDWEVCVCITIVRMRSENNYFFFPVLIVLIKALSSSLEYIVMPLDIFNVLLLRSNQK